MQEQYQAGRTVVGREISWVSLRSERHELDLARTAASQPQPLPGSQLTVKCSCQQSGSGEPLFHQTATLTRTKQSQLSIRSRDKIRAQLCRIVPEILA